MKALITGITGQDGSYLADLLLSKGYEVHGMIRRVAAERVDFRLSRIYHILPRLHLHQGSLESLPSMWEIVKDVNPDEIYHLAGQSFVQNSFEDERTTFQTNLDGTHNLLVSVRKLCPRAKLYFAATSEMYGNNFEHTQHEGSPMRPVSAYGIAKLAAFQLCSLYRSVHGLFICCGILFNHESPRRGEEFITRKVSLGVARIAAGLQDAISVGNLDAERDWGYAPDYVNAMHRMLQKTDPRDYVVATGETHTVKAFIDEAFRVAKPHMDAKGIAYGDHMIRVVPRLLRPAELHTLKGDATLARCALGWTPQVRFRELVKIMVEHDLKLMGCKEA